MKNGQVMKQMLISGNISVAELPAKFGIKANTYNKMQSGNPQLKWFIDFANACGCKVLIKAKDGTEYQLTEGKM